MKIWTRKRKRGKKRRRNIGGGKLEGHEEKEKLEKVQM